MSLNTIIFVLGMAIFVAVFQLLDRIIGRRREKKKASRKHTSTRARRYNMLKGKKEFVAALAVVVMVLVLFALPYAVTEVYGLKAMKLILLMYLVVLAGFSVASLIWWPVRYKQTSRDSDMRRPLDLEGGNAEHRRLGHTRTSLFERVWSRVSYAHANGGALF